MEINKYIVYSLVVLLIAVVAFNFEAITGNVVDKKEPVIIITNLQQGDVLKDRVTARLKIENSFA